MRAQQRHTRTGKARQVHHRNRAIRLNAQQQMIEAFENEFEPAVLRLKPPILARPSREFVPSADPTFDPTGADTQEQLNLPFGRPAPCNTSGPSGSSTCQARLEEAVEAAPTTMVTKYRRNGLSAAADTQAEFTLGGLLYGCLIGSATAALILVCLRALLP